MSQHERDDPPVRDRERGAMPPLDLGGRAVAPRATAPLRDGARGEDPTVGARWLRSAWGRWTLRLAAAAAFLALGAWYGISVAHTVARDLTPDATRLEALRDPVFRTPGGVAPGDLATGVRRASDAYVAELQRLAAQGDRLTDAERRAAEAAARDALAKALEELARRE